jgi:hypothetical protein
MKEIKTIFLVFSLLFLLAPALGEEAQSYVCKCVLDPGRSSRPLYQVVRFDPNPSSTYKGEIWDNIHNSDVILKAPLSSGQKHWVQDSRGRTWLIEILERVYAK